MFPVKHPGLGYARKAAAWAGIAIDPSQERLLTVLADWLIGEAIPSGGLGPGEADRIWPRHIADSLTFAVGWRDGPPPSTLVDIGCGVGLPGIPLAITHPGVAVTLLDRSERRLTLARRAIRVLGLGNLTTVGADATHPPGRFAAATMRAVFPAPDAVSVVTAFLEPEGTGVIGASRRVRPTHLAGATIVEVPAGVLDSPAWLLRMTAPT